MLITYLTGDLFDTPSPIILHGCNAQGGMGSGVAKIIRAKYPNAYLAYRKAYEQAKEDEIDFLGQVVYAEDNGKWIANGVTQRYYGRDEKCYVSYEAINTVMTQVHDFALEHEMTHVAMPLIGAGLGGGSWKRIAGIIEDCFVDVTPVVYALDGNIPNS